MLNKIKNFFNLIFNFNLSLNSLHIIYQNMYLLHQTKSLDLIKESTLESFYILSTNVNNYTLNNNFLNFLDTRYHKNFINQFKHIQINQVILLSFLNHDSPMILDFYHSLSSKSFYNDANNLYLTNYNYKFENTPQYINNNGCMFLYKSVQNYLNNEFIQINKIEKLDESVIKYFEKNKNLIKNKLVKNYYSNYINFENNINILNYNKEKLIKF